MSEDEKKAAKEKVKKNLEIARKTWDELHALPAWIDDDYAWEIQLQGVYYNVIYIDSNAGYIELESKRGGKQKDFTHRSKFWEELVEELATTAPSKVF